MGFHVLCRQPDEVLASLATYNSVHYYLLVTFSCVSLIIAFISGGHMPTTTTNDTPTITTTTTTTTITNNATAITISGVTLISMKNIS